jgi:hypothetical protein
MFINLVLPLRSKKQGLKGGIVYDYKIQVCGSVRDSAGNMCNWRHIRRGSVGSSGDNRIFIDGNVRNRYEQG